METAITTAQLADGLSVVLNRVKYRGERFVVQCNGETIAIIMPAMAKTGTTWAEFRAKVGDLELSGDGFAEDLEAIQAARGNTKLPEWLG